MIESCVHGTDPQLSCPKCHREIREDKLLAQVLFNTHLVIANLEDAEEAHYPDVRKLKSSLKRLLKTRYGKLTLGNK